jgi:hypothetical protein
MPKRQRKNPAAVSLGRLGGLARGRTIRDVMPPAKRIMLARHAALARWAQVRAKKEKETETP